MFQTDSDQTKIDRVSDLANGMTQGQRLTPSPEGLVSPRELKEEVSFAEFDHRVVSGRARGDEGGEEGRQRLLVVEVDGGERVGHIGIHNIYHTVNLGNFFKKNLKLFYAQYLSLSSVGMAVKKAPARGRPQRA